jgi:leucyl-tRNA synthetase
MYNHQEIEKKWQKIWAETDLYKTGDDPKKPKYYILDMFPYPSGAGLHVGHPKGYIATDIFARLRLMQGYNVLHPMGFDAFGLPAENYALKNKVHPRQATDENIAVFKKQLEILGFSYDWAREVVTTDPKYYKWTQWIFLQMWKAGLAYESNEPINWCPSCKTGLANEDLENGKCERCGSEVEQKPLRQWVLRITNYAERLLNDLDKLTGWEESIKEMQRNWIGRSEGAEVDFRIKTGDALSDKLIKVFTTRVDTIFGCTYVVLAPENNLVTELKMSVKNWSAAEQYINEVKNKTDLQRTDLNKEKTGVVLEGVKAINPFNNEEVPVFIADYVLNSYGTGAVMAVPAHDERDWDFAKKYDLEIRQSIAPLFTVMNGPDTPRPEKKTVRRSTIYAFVKHWSEDKYLCLDWEKFGWHSGIIGGQDSGEDPLTAAQREIREETGYKNIKFIRNIGGEMHNNFFAGHKDENRYATGHCLLFQLIDEEQEDTQAEHTKNHQTVWISGPEMKEWLNLQTFVYSWGILSGGSECFTADGVLINSAEFTDLKSSEARQKMTKWLEKKKAGEGKVNYKIKDWVFSRQRYWGEPIPLIHCAKCGVVAVPEDELPVRLPEVKSYEPTGTGESPLAVISDWVKVKCPKCGGAGKRETNTMPQWAGSCWYYLRYIDPNNEEAMVDKKKEKYWSPVDFYVGGAEHATRHLIYARFWHKFLYDIKAVAYDEPFTRLQHVGLIMGEDGRKMSKRWGNVINPNDIVVKYGADAMRIYEMFMGPFAQAVNWNTNGLVGARKFLEKITNLVDSSAASNSQGGQSEDAKKATSLLHKTIKKVGEDIENFNFNTAVSALMILTNELTEYKNKNNSLPLSGADLQSFLKILAPLAPHLAEELWQKIGELESIFRSSWPKYDSKLLKDETINLVVQINGKLRATLEVEADIPEKEAINLAQSNEAIKKWLAGKEIVKNIFVPGKLLNIVVK